MNDGESENSGIVTLATWWQCILHCDVLLCINYIYYYYIYYYLLLLLFIIVIIIVIRIVSSVLF